MMARAARVPTVVREIRTIDVENEEIEVVYDRVPLSEVRLDPANPRIQHLVHAKYKGRTPTQDQLCSLILDMSGVSDLFKSVRDNGGLMEPIHILSDGRVAEGNCRAACYMKLRRVQPNERRWQSIAALRLPDDITDRQVAVLQGQFHVAGKTKWRPYEKAGHIHSMNVDRKMDAKSISKALGIQERVVTRLLEAFEFWKSELLPLIPTDKILDKWSHVEEFFKNTELSDYRLDAKNRKEFAKLVADGKIKGGADVRKLPKIFKSRRATQALKKDGVTKAIEVVGRKDPTADSLIFRKIKDMTAVLGKISAEEIQRLKDQKQSKDLLRELLTAVKQVCQLAEISTK
jgi:hypothetical protein